MTVKELIKALKKVEDQEGLIVFSLHTYHQGHVAMISSPKSTLEKFGYEYSIFQYSKPGGIRIDLHMDEGYQVSKKKGTP